MTTCSLRPKPRPRQQTPPTTRAFFRKAFGAPSHRTPGYDAVVFSGAGIRGLSMLGVCHYLKKNHLLKDATTFLGSSAGAIVATVLAMGLDPYEVFKREVIPFTWKSGVDLNLLDSGAGCRYGIDSGANLEAWIARIIPSDVTFRDILDTNGSTLVVTVTNLNKRHAEYFGPLTTPDVSIAKALRMSCSVPLYFSAVMYEGELFVDGGICDNFPIEAACEMGCKNILGFRFVTTPKPRGTRWTFDTFAGALVESTLFRRVPKNATVVGLECGSTTQPLNFKISNDIKHRLFREGFEQTGLFFKKNV